MHPRPVVPYLLPLLLVLLALLAAPVQAAPVQAAPGDVVGRVITATGEVAAVGGDGERRALARRDPVYEGDTLVTGDPGRAQIRFQDQGLTDLRPGSRFEIEKYRAGKATGDEEKGVALRLIEGGLRTITGAVGKENRKDYRLNTAVASIGIRGTQYQVNFCQSDCGGGAPGLYGGVADGAIGVSNQGGSATFGQDQYFYVASNSQAPEGLLTPPGGVLGGFGGDRDGDGEEGGEGQEGSEGSGKLRDGLAGAVDDAEGEDPASGGALSAEEYEAGEEATEDLEKEADEFFAGAVLAMGFSLFPVLDLDSSELNSSPYYGGASFDFDSGALTGVTMKDSTGESLFEITTSGEPVSQGEDDDLGLRWGRWADYAVTIDGETFSYNTDFHYVHARALTSAERLQDLSGSATYNWAEGDVSHQNSTTYAMAVDRLELGVNFDKQELSSVALDLIYTNDNGSTPLDPNVSLQLSQAVKLSPATFAGLESSRNSDTGNMVILFTGDRAEGAGVGFTFSDVSTEGIGAGSGIVVRQ